MAQETQLTPEIEKPEPHNKHVRTPEVEVMDSDTLGSFLVEVRDPDPWAFPDVEGAEVLSEAVLWMFPTERGYKFRLFWRDREGDLKEGSLDFPFFDERDRFDHDRDDVGPAEGMNNVEYRELEYTVRENESLGFVVSVHDPNPQVRGVIGDVEPKRNSVEVQIKPSDLGFKLTCWWEEDGKRKQRDDHIWFREGEQP